jgi:hypothetical protein
MTATGAAGTDGAMTISKATQATAMPLSEKQAVKVVQLALPNLRGQIELFRLMNQSTTPPLANGTGTQTGWESFVDAKMIKEAPKNEYIGGTNAMRVVLGTRPDSTFHNNYGWVFNPQTGQLWAAGFDANDKPLPKTGTATTSTPEANPVQAPTADATTEPLSSRMTPKDFDDAAWTSLFGFSPSALFKQPAAMGTGTNPTATTAGVETDNNK